MKAFLNGFLYVINQFYHYGHQTMVLREEDINFPPTKEQFYIKSHPILHSLSL
jgi:hypothetical protein